MEESNPLIRDTNVIILESFDHTKKKELSKFKLVTLTICFLGIQFGWAVQIAYSSPIFLELGVPKSLVSLIWLAGPISGLLVQPTVGVLSDNCHSRLGRRRPFIVTGAVFVVIGMLMISNAKEIGQIIGKSEHHYVAILIAVLGFWVLDLSNNTVQGPCRALLVDLAPPNQQNLGGSYFSFMLGAGNLLGYLAGSLRLTRWFPFFKTDLRALFTLGIIVLLLCVLVTVSFATESPLKSHSTPRIKNPFFSIVKGIVGMPSGMRRICAVQFFAWFAWFTFILYITTWVGENVFHGDPSAPANSLPLQIFQAGVRFGALGLTLFSLVTVLCSLLLPYLSRNLGIKPVFFVCQMVLSICLLLPLWVHSKPGALILIASCGIPWTAVMVFPFTIVANSVDESESGLSMGVLNIFVVVPQILVAVVIGMVIKLFAGNLVSALVVGAVSALISAILVWTLIVKEREPVEINIVHASH